MALKAGSWVGATLPQMLHPPQCELSSLAWCSWVAYGSGPESIVLLSSLPLPYSFSYKFLRSQTRGLIIWLSEPLLPSHGLQATPTILSKSEVPQHRASLGTLFLGPWSSIPVPPLRGSTLLHDSQVPGSLLLREAALSEPEVVF